MKNKFTVAFCLALFAITTGCKKENFGDEGHQIKPALESLNKVNAITSKFKIVGYLPLWDLANASSSVNFGKITHLNIGFFNPDENGNFPGNPDLRNAAALAHANNVKILAAIAGGSPPVNFKILMEPANQNKFIASLVQLTQNYCLDGIDVDIEQDLINENYESFVTKLSAALKAKGKLITAAVATVYKDNYSPKALACYDFINIMSYDKTGPWNPAAPGQHSPYSMAVDDLAYWGGTAGIAKEKLILGVPFYGWGFGPNAPEALSFADIVTQYPGSQNLDQVSVTGGGVIYYNGITTIENKTRLALQKAGGMMIWNLSQDAKGEFSLLSRIGAISSKH
jgi:chitinase